MIIGAKRKKSTLAGAEDRRLKPYEVKRKKSKSTGNLPECNENESFDSDDESKGVVSECTETHDLKEMVDVKIPGSASKVNEMLFSSKSTWLKDFLRNQNYTNMNLGEFEDSEGETKRLFTYTMPVKGNLGPKTANVKEMLTKCKSCKEDSLYVYNGDVTNSGVPYQDAFYLVSHYCIASQGSSQCRFYMGLEVRYRKSVWSMVKNMIEKGSYSQAAELYGDMAKALSATLSGKSEKDTKTKTKTAEADNKSTASFQTQASTPMVSSQLMMWIIVGLLILFNFILYWKVSSIQTYSVVETPQASSNEKAIGESDMLNDSNLGIPAHGVKDWRQMMQIVIRELKKNEILVEALRHQLIMYHTDQRVEEQQKMMET